MMSLVGGDFNNQAAAAAAAVAASNASAAAAAAAACAASSAAVALGVQPATLLATNANDIYSLAQMGGLHQQLLQQSAAVFQNYTSMDDDDNNTNLNNALNAAVAAGGIMVNSNGKPVTTAQFLTTDNGQQHNLQQQNQQIYDQMDDGYEDGMSDLTPKQEIINIDDFVMMTDSNSYDGTDFINSDDKSASGIDITQPHEVDEHDLLVPMSDEHKILSEAAAAANRNLLAAAQAASTSSNSLTSRGGGVASSSHTGGGNLRSQRKTRKIEPVNRPGLVLKTPIAYKGNIDPSVIPIQKDGMGRFCFFFYFID